MADIIDFNGGDPDKAAEASRKNGKKGGRPCKREGALQLEGFSRWCQLGANRTITALGKAWPNGPTDRTLYDWHKAFQWEERAGAYDRKVASAALAYAADRQANAHGSALVALQDTVGYCAQLIQDAALLKNGTVLAINNAQDLRTVVSTLIDATKLAETLTGGVSDRTATVSQESPEMMALDKALEKLSQKATEAKG